MKMGKAVTCVRGNFNGKRCKESCHRAGKSLRGGESHESWGFEENNNSIRRLQPGVAWKNRRHESTMYSHSIARMETDHGSNADPFELSGGTDG